jgi:hypothetical protein
MRTLLIDNYDSYTFNLFHLLGEVNGEEPIVVRNDELSWARMAALDVDNMLEASWANVWAREGNRLVTPPADGRLLPGTARARLRHSHAETAEEPLTVERLQAADAILLTSALRTIEAGLTPSSA